MVEHHPKPDDETTSGPASLEESKQPEIQESDIIDRGYEGEVNGLTGEEVARYFRLDGERFGLVGEEYSQFDDLVERVADRKEIENKISRQFVRDKSFEWLERCYTGNFSSIQYAEFLLSKAEEAIGVRRVHMPIQYLLVDETIKLGRVIISYLPQELFDGLKEHYERNLPNQLERVGKIRDEYQGQVTASLKVEAEKQKAVEIAKNEIEKTLAFLRFFSPSAILAEIPSRWNVMDKPAVVWTRFLVSSGEVFPDILKVNERYIGKKKSNTNKYWSIDNKQVRRFRELEIVHGHRILLEEEPTAVDDLITNCVLLFNKSLLEKERRDRLVFLLVCLETLLLKNSGEPIQKSVGQRLAVIEEGRDVDERKEIIDLVKQMHSARSEYVHHGEQVDLEISVLSKFQRLVWQAVHHLMANRKKYDKKLEFIEELETRLLS
jgi:hypothetical protein